MKALFYRIPRKVRLALSAALLLVSVYLLWSLLNFGMPTQELALRKAEAELGLPRGAWSTTDLLPDERSSNSGERRFSRREDDFYVAWPLYNSHFNFLWEVDISKVSPLVPLRLMDIPAPDSRSQSRTWVYLVTTSDSATARVALILDGQTAACTETAPGSGFWIGSLQVPDRLEGKGLSALAHAYSADGTLLQ